ncbi:MAG TPA: GNAT family N-acetyltransferase [Phycisphaerae bacterium]|nr:GNAT family N-acetyltransferase [Phycisphaerae bacterium]
MGIQIDYLAKHKEFIPTLAQWHHQEWAYLRPDDSIDKRIDRLREAARRHAAVPTVVIAFAGDKLFGSAMLVANDMDTRMELSPWLAGVFVAPQYRKQGIGAALVGRVITDAWSLGVDRLYLYTPNTQLFYSRLGWSVVERMKYCGLDVVVMSFDCAT